MTGLLRSELRKVLTTRLWWGLLIGLVASWAGLSALIASLSGADSAAAGGPGLPLDDPATIRGIYTAGLGTGYLFALAFGVIAMAGEYRQQTITATLLCSPRRERVVVAKLAAVAVVGLCYGLAGVIGGLLGGVPVLAVRGTSAHLADDGVPRALATSVLAIALWAVVGLGVGTLIRNQVVALLVSIGVAWIAEPLIALALNAAHAGGVAKFLPGQATSALVSPPTSTGAGLSQDMLPWWGGTLVLLAYAVASGALGAGLTLRRDIS
jgi:ABC-type transport system involved in multi-copper enzyme maturation permease subunit